MAVYLMEATLLSLPRAVRADAAASCCYCGSCSVSPHEIKQHSDLHCSMAAALATHTHPSQQHPATRPTLEGQKLPLCAAPQQAGLQELVCEPAASFKTNTSTRFFSGMFGTSASYKTCTYIMIQDREEEKNTIP